MDCGRLILDWPASGAWNMAVDEALLFETAQTGTSVLRFYGWREPTISIGYFQAVAERQQHAASWQCPLVRRTTGGGAIIHDRELTYSYCAPVSDRMGGNAVSLYDAFHETLRDVLLSFGVAASLCSTPVRTTVRSEPFLCFQRFMSGDVLVDGWKVAGSAQRRRKGVVLQHGSILLQVSERAPELPGIFDLARQTIDLAELSERWTRRLAERLELRFSIATRDETVLATAARWEHDKFGSAAWTGRR